MTAVTAPRQARLDDVPAIADVLTAAFAEDPVLSWSFPRARSRRRHGHRFYRAVARRLVPQGVSWVEPDGAALWALPGQWRESPSEALRIAAGSVAGTLPHPLRVARGLLGVEARHPVDPHLYLLVIGVHPRAKGQGIGTRLLAPGLAHADALGLPAYLESSNPRNNPLYERHGFVVQDEVRLPGGPPVWLMWRAARSG